MLKRTGMMVDDAEMDGRCSKEMDIDDAYARLEGGAIQRHRIRKDVRIGGVTFLY